MAITLTSFSERTWSLRSLNSEKKNPASYSYSGKTENNLLSHEIPIFLHLRQWLLIVIGPQTMIVRNWDSEGTLFWQAAEPDLQKARTGHGATSQCLAGNMLLAPTDKDHLSCITYYQCIKYTSMVMCLCQYRNTGKEWQILKVQW